MAAPAEKLFELRRTTFDTPHFRGIEFLEVEAKSIINKVPGNRFAFNWTINPYRGCSHACSYCQSGETPVLMADGRTRRLGDLSVADKIVGTTFDGKYRRYVTTEVLAHWQTVKRAYRITLEDGTELTASGDHRFLARGRGWKHVTGRMSGRGQRPYLTTNDHLVGIGHFAPGPRGDADYKRGYLCGMIRGDGSLGVYPLRRPNGRVDSVHRFRLALADLEALRRSRAYLGEAGVGTTEFVFSEAVGAHRAVHALRNQSAAGFATVSDIIEWPHHPSDEWRKGFLAGIFDAEGGCSAGVLRISNSDREIVGTITSSMKHFGFSVAHEMQPGTNKPVEVVRLLGGLRERMRFFHTVDPAITRKRCIPDGMGIKGDSQLRVIAIKDLGLEIPMYDITTGTGDFIANGVVSHNCFARSTHTYLDMNAGSDFSSKIVVKVNAPQLLRKELRAKRWTGESIAMGTATDPYQRAEGRYRLTRGIIETLTEVRNPFSILTKGTLILRDIDLLQDAAAVSDVSTAFSIPTLDEAVWRTSEPGTPHPMKRMEAVRRLNDAGIPCGVLVAPVLPGLSDGEDQLRAVVTAAVEAGATFVSPILLHLRPKVREVYLEWLAATYPDLVPRYLELYPKTYASAAEKKKLSATVSGILDDLPRSRRRPRPRRPPVELAKLKSSLHAEQLKML
ncbi:MAG TPA: radical SAM protein [Actinomycetota bacterium]|nr:radical SAM protein [Actinomycetota bacterium]